MSIRTGVCEPWTSVADVQSCGPCNDVALETDQIDRWIGPASDALFVLTGRQFAGPCEESGFRPCPPCACGRCGYHDWGRRCAPSSQVALGVYPVTEVSEVLIDGVVLDPDRYRVDEGRWLVRLADADGSRAFWPRANDLDLPDTEAGTWSVSFTYGKPPPDLCQEAAAELACELAMACAGSDKCRLSRRVQSITRQGVTMALLDPRALIDPTGSLGLPICDLAIRTYNPKGRRRAASVWSPDLPRSGRRVG